MEPAAREYPEEGRIEPGVPRVDPADVVRRLHAVGVHAGAPLTWVETPADVFALAAPAMAAAEVRLGELVASEVDVVEAIGAYLTAAGGKRLRPLLTALGAGAVGHTGRLDGLMCAGELIHLGSLLHDDVVDDGATRRGQPAAQRVYGNAAVILTGDFCLARAVLLAATDGGHAAVTALAEAVTAMAEGEVLQLQRAGNLDTTLEQYLDMIDKKSAALIAWCAAAGALAAGDTVAAEALACFGRGVGVAFQITDDVLDYAAGTGKPAGQDLREKKLTLPLLLAMERVPDLRARLHTDDLDVLLAVVRRSGALDAAQAEARRRVDLAVGALDVLPPSIHRDALVVLGRYLVERSS
ncbi:MAG: polyprenyl synthetase family protein [Pseudomonadota bacterium]|nr:polyprenyl synthetase family protein [Pseudomonadota bacterium]